MKVNEVMSHQVEIVSPGDSIQRAAQMLARIDAAAFAGSLTCC